MQRRAVQRPDPLANPVLVQQRPPEPFSLRQRFWISYSGEYAFSMCEPWETISIHLVFFIFIAALVYGLTFLPAHLRIIAKRAHYYLYGTYVTPSILADL